jgi:hypothetical protein
MRKAGHAGLSEPFAGLFTQGMITHETYKDADGKWLFPEQVEKRDGVVPKRDTHTPVDVGPIEKMSKSKKNVVPPEAVADTYGVDAARWFMMSDCHPSAIRSGARPVSREHGVSCSGCGACSMTACLSCPRVEPPALRASGRRPGGSKGDPPDNRRRYRRPREVQVQQGRGARV